MKFEEHARRLRQALGLLLLLVASVSVALGAVELLLRGNVIPNEYYVRNEVLGDGENGPLVFIIGDSFMAPHVGGDVVDLIYAALSPHGVRIRNTATSGTGPVQYLENLRREGRRYRPDVVLLSYYVGNDLLDVGCGGGLDERLRPMPSPAAWKKTYTAQFLRERLRARFPGRVIFQSVVPRVPLWELIRPKLLHLVEPSSQKVDYDQMKKAGIPDEYIAAARTGEINPWTVSLGARYPDYYRDALLMRSECAERAWADTKRVLDLILAEAETLNARVLPVMFPHTFQVDTAHHALYRALKISVDREMLEMNRPQELLHEYFRDRGLAPLDLLDPFRSQGAMLYWDRDEHLNGRGQELSAKLISAALLRDDVPTAVGQSAAIVDPRPRRPRVPPITATPSPPVALPFHLEVGDSAARPWMVSGWSTSDSTGGRPFTWSQGARSVLRVALPTAGDIRMDFEALPFVFGGSPAQRVTIVVNGTTVDEVHVRPGLRRYSVILSAKARGAAPHTVEFRYAYARAPQEVHQASSDVRRLAVAWYSVDFAAVDR